MIKLFRNGIRLIYPPATVGRRQKQCVRFVAVPPKTGFKECIIVVKNSQRTDEFLQKKWLKLLCLNKGLNYDNMSSKPERGPISKHPFKKS